MASGTIEMSCSKAWAGQIKWSSTADAANNQSKVTVTVTTWKTDGYTSGGNSPFSGTLTINGISYSFSYDTEYTTHSSRISKTVTIKHGTDGKKSITISASVKGASSALTGTTLSGSKTVALDAIGNAESTISLTQSSVTMGEKLAIQISPKVPTYRHNISIDYGDGKGYMALVKDIATLYQWVVPTSLAAKCSDKTSMTVTVRCSTYKNSTDANNISGRIGSYSKKTVVLKVPDSDRVSIDGSKVTLGDAAVINFKRNADNFSHVLKWEFPENSGNVTTLVDNVKSDSMSWTPEYDYASRIPSQQYANGKLTLTTYNGEAKVGDDKTAIIQVSVPDNSETQPKINSVTLDMLSDGLENPFDTVYIQGKSGVTITVDAESQYSTIADYAVKVGALSGNGTPCTFNRISASGRIPVTVTVTDARRYSSTYTTEISALPYQAPKLTPAAGQSKVICERSNSIGVPDSDGRYLLIKARKECTYMEIDGENANFCTMMYRYRPAGLSFTEWSEIAGESDSGADLILPDIVTNTDLSCEVELAVIDTLGSVATLTFLISTSIVNFHLYPGPAGAAFGKRADTPNVVDIASNMKLRVLGELEVVGSGFQPLYLNPGITTPEGAPGRVDPGCYISVENGRHVYVAFNVGIGVLDMSGVVINSELISNDLRPRHEVRSLCIAAVGSDSPNAIVIICVKPTGQIVVEQAAQFGGAWINNTTVQWIDGYIDYWI